MKKSKSTSGKLETLRSLSRAVFALEASKGHLGWKVTDLARKSGLSRALIYRYLGSSKPEMLASVVKYFLNEFYGIDHPENGLLFSEQIRHARTQMSQFPEAILFYIKWRAKTSKLQKELIEIELKFQAHVQE